jgi:SAM-dependent methyltransferase
VSAAALLRCPHCAAELSAETRCGACGGEFAARAGYVDFIASAARDGRALEVTEFYQRNPFPGYAPSDDATTLLERSRRSPFLVELDRAIAPDAAVLDCGCGTGQLAAFLALAAPHRRVVGVDACPASLGAAAAFRERARIRGLSHYLCDLFRLPLAPGAFDVVVSRGVVHHTPDPAAAMRAVARHVAPGGVLVLGFYENVARAFHRARRRLASLCGEPLRFLDPVLRRADVSAEKKQIWIEDQYRHPLEHMLALPWVVAELEAAGFEWLRSYPPTLSGGSLFDPTPRPGRAGLGLRRLGWALAGLNDPDAGLVSVILRRRPGPQPAP